MATGRVPTTANSPLTTKGDLFGYSTAPARLAVGNNGETIVADSSTATGLRYQGTNAAGRNVLINGNFDIWQRGTTSAAIGYGNLLADRWKILNNGTGQNTTYSRDTSVPNAGSLYSAKVQQLTSAATGVSEYNLSQIFETSNIYQLCGKTVTMSFWYRASTTGTHYARIYCLQTGGTDITNSFTVNAANTWEYKTITFSSFAAVTAIATADNANGGGVQVGPIVFGSGVNRTVAINENFQITQVQIEAGSVATNFTRAGGSIQGELAACQRYFVRQSGSTASQAYTIFGMALAPSTTNVDGAIMYPVRMRTTPTLSVSGSVRAYDGSNWLTASSFSLIDATEFSGGLRLAVSGATQFRPYKIQAQADSAAYVDYSAEL